MSNNDNEFLKLQFAQIHSTLGRFEKIFPQLFQRIDRSNTILARNTVIVDEHQKRSTILEKEVKSQAVKINELEKVVIRLEDTGGRLSKLESEVNKTRGLLKSIPLGFKIVAAFLGLLIGSFGLYKLIVEIIQLASKIS